MDKTLNRWVHIGDRDAGPCDTCSIPEMIETLSIIAGCLRHDACLDDLAAPVQSICDELRERRRIAIAVAEELDAERCSLKH